ncbi:MAG TPA: type I methionyl aminopeptidase [Candidatus Dojkabacteria bacterium]|nr:type I methionyl aminopeptidase [Candidatus Dojkabacteria bacterium]
MKYDEHRIKMMGEGGKICASIMEQMTNEIKVGVNSLEIEEISKKLCKEASVVPAFLGYNNYPSATCIMVNDEIEHAIPKSYVFKDGDAVTVDFGIIYEGYYLDMTRSVILGSNPVAEKMHDLVSRILDNVTAMAVTGLKVGDIGFYVENEVNRAGFAVVRELGGHSIGEKLHMDPVIPNFGKKNKGPRLEFGHTMAIEIIIAEKSGRMMTDPNGWTLRTIDGGMSVMKENTIMVGNERGEVLTKI